MRALRNNAGQPNCVYRGITTRQVIAELESENVRHPSHPKLTVLPMTKARPHLAPGPSLPSNVELAYNMWPSF